MNQLPVEVVERILRHCDGYSLIRAPFVCTLWRELAILIDKRPIHWKRVCFDEMLRCVLLEMTVTKFPFWRSYLPNSQFINWKDLYITWLCWKIIKNFKYHVDVASEHKPGHVTCFKFIANTMVVGLHNGEINTWQTLNGDPYVISKHRTRVTCLDVISILDERNVPVADRRIRYVVSTSHDGRVKISHLIKEGMSPKVFDVCQHNCSTVCIRVQQSYFAILDANGTVTVWMVEPPKHRGVMPMVHLVANYRPRPGCTMVSLDIWGGVVTGMTKYGVILNADFYRYKDTMLIGYTPHDHTVRVSVVGENMCYLTQVNYHNEIGIAKCYTWRNQIFLWITDAKKIMISLDGLNYFEYDTNKYLRSYAKSALIYGNILYLGMESGALYMYYFRRPQDLLNLDLRMFHWYHPVANSPILAIEICEESTGPLLAVLSKTNIYIIEWSITYEDVIDKKLSFNPL